MCDFTLTFLKREPLDLRTLENQYVPEEEDVENKYNPFFLTQFQNYNPNYSVLFPDITHETENICLNHKYHIRDLFTVFDLGKPNTLSLVEKSIFVKSSPLLDPIRYMIGKYETCSDFVFPKHNLEKREHSTITADKLGDSNNASYVDGFFSFLTGQILHTHDFIHGVEYYGSFLGLQQQYKFDASDDFDYLSNSTFFVENHQKLFQMHNKSLLDGIQTKYSRTNRRKLQIGSKSNIGLEEDTVEEELITHLEDEPLTENTDLEEIFIQNKNDLSEEESCKSKDTSALGYVSDDDDSLPEEDEEPYVEEEEKEEHQYSEDDDWETDEDESVVEKEIVFIKNFPVQLIFLEKCHGTIDELFENEQINCNEGISALFQIIMTLLAYQKAFEFTHNDLHTNNIMYVETEEEFLYYKFKNDIYRVPTYGKIYKIIDFGRAIYKYNNHLFCSDSFSEHGDAATQYNFEPYLNINKPRIEPNYSFDLCRLGCSIYDFIIPDSNMPVFKMDDLQRLVHDWCLDDGGKSVLYKRNGEERYHNFKLYKMIARTVHVHTPEAQLSKKVFRQFLVENAGTAKKIMDIDSIPCYA